MNTFLGINYKEDIYLQMFRFTKHFDKGQLFSQLINNTN